MTPVSPEWAVSCIEAGIPYMAICYAEAHATLLNQCLSHRIFQKFTDESDSMFVPRAAKLVSGDSNNGDKDGPEDEEEVGNNGEEDDDGEDVEPPA
eukprot:2343997-Pyramimonas_sp.AAC.1